MPTNRIHTFIYTKRSRHVDIYYAACIYPKTFHIRLKLIAITLKYTLSTAKRKFMKANYWIRTYISRGSPPIMNICVMILLWFSLGWLLCSFLLFHCKSHPCFLWKNNKQISKHLNYFIIISNIPFHIMSKKQKILPL